MGASGHIFTSVPWDLSYHCRVPVRATAALPGPRAHLGVTRGLCTVPGSDAAPAAPMCMVNSHSSPMIRRVTDLQAESGSWFFTVKSFEEADAHLGQESEGLHAEQK